MTSVAIIDCGSGNLRSVAKAFERAARESGRPDDVVVTADPDMVLRADRAVLPGVGAFADCRAGLAAVDGMIEAIERFVRDRARPFLGICVGMQLLATRGLEHGVTSGFGWIDGDVVRLVPADPALKVPHMGWNELQVRAPTHPLLQGLAGPPPHAYFVHSYRLAARRREQVLATVDYGGEIAAVVGTDNLVGTQFHPEKSQAAGLRLIANFLGWQP